MTTPHPYSDLPDTAFWKSAVAQKAMLDIGPVWRPKFTLRAHHRIVTFGSCFAQHIGRALEARGFNWLRTETAPKGLSDANRKRFNFGIFSARTGNIYTTSLLRQWTEWALELTPVPDEVWEKEGRFYDPFRPAIEPNGFASPDEVRVSRARTIEAFRTAIASARYFVFTLGLTESWHNTALGHEYPMCPGTVAGTFDASVHAFENQDFATIYRNLSLTADLMRTINPRLRFILTVSPVPLTATASDEHVLVATTGSKATLRTVAGEIARRRKVFDYFPSYEIITAPPFKGGFFEPNQRDVTPDGVAFVMDSFFRCLNGAQGETVQEPVAPTASLPVADKQGDTVCEEAMLAAFGPAR